MDFSSSLYIGGETLVTLLIGEPPWTLQAEAGAECAGAPFPRESAPWWLIRSPRVSCRTQHVVETQGLFVYRFGNVIKRSTDLSTLFISVTGPRDHETPAR